MLADRDADIVSSSSSNNSRDGTAVFAKPDNRGTIDAFINSIQRIDDDLFANEVS